ncbi:MAG: ABC transporter ATP-binding protein [Deltaproteobacteria bacterium]|nr:ABC transporter ATP-binding protein [Deltaproteobacteria bacterium]MBN2846679.1 ABC transporter ATP-binding protein [Deltaproteobacteria bacterium]
MIDIQGLSKTFGTTLAVENLTLAIPKGEFFTLLGPNGAGKTTTLKIVAGLLRPTKGRVFVGGHNMAKKNTEAKRLISFIPDIPYIYEKLTGREFLYFIGELYELDRDRLRNETERLLELFYMEDYGNQLMESYSHGMRQKIVICSALLPEPRLIIIDEPMVGLDPRSIRLVKDILRSSADDGMTVLMSTHTLALAEEISDRIGILHRGQLISEGSLEEIKKQSKETEKLEDIFLTMTAED